MRPRNSHIVISVEDTGIGIPEFKRDLFLHPARRCSDRWAAEESCQGDVDIPHLRR